MKQRPRDPEPIAHHPRRRARTVEPHWIDHVTRVIGIAALGFLVLLAVIGHAAGSGTPPVGSTTTAVTHVGER